MQLGAGHGQRDARRAPSPPSAATRSPTCSSRSRRPTCSTRSAGRSIRPASIASASVCASSSNARSAATASWSSRCRPSSWRSTSAGASRPGTGSSRRVTGYTRAEMLGTDGRRAGGDGRAARTICRSRRAARARCAGAAPRFPTGDGAPLVYAVGIDVTDEQEMLLPHAARGAAGGGRHDGRRAGPRGPQPAQLGVAPAHRARASAGPRRDRRPGHPDRPHHQERDRPARSARARLPGVREATPARSTAGRRAALLAGWSS